MADSSHLTVADVPSVSMHWPASWVVMAAMSTASGPSGRSQSTAAVGFFAAFSGGCAAGSFERPTARPAGRATQRQCCHSGVGWRGARRRYGCEHSSLDRGCQTGPSSFQCPLHCSRSPLCPPTSAHHYACGPHFLPPSLLCVTSLVLPLTNHSPACRLLTKRWRFPAYRVGGLRCAALLHFFR